MKTIRRAFLAEGMGSIHEGLDEKSMTEEDGWLYGLDCIGQGKGFGLLLV